RRSGRGGARRTVLGAEPCAQFDELCRPGERRRSQAARQPSTPPDRGLPRRRLAAVRAALVSAATTTLARARRAAWAPSRSRPRAGDQTDLLDRQSRNGSVPANVKWRVSLTRSTSTSWPLNRT